jgi:hypothetical protein
VKDNEFRLEIGDAQSLKVSCLIPRSRLIEPENSLNMKLLRVLGMSSKPQVRSKARHSDRVLGAIGHLNHGCVVLVEVESGIELMDNHIILVVLKGLNTCSAP